VNNTWYLSEYVGKDTISQDCEDIVECWGSAIYNNDENESSCKWSNENVATVIDAVSMAMQ
jgi:hypothetical protein